MFIDRVFEECRLYDGEMDYKTFVDFTLAMTYKHRPESLAYFFKLLDVRNRGKLTVRILAFILVQTDLLCRLFNCQEYVCTA